MDSSLITLCLGNAIVYVNSCVCDSMWMSVIEYVCVGSALFAIRRANTRICSQPSSNDVNTPGVFVMAHYVFFHFSGYTQTSVNGIRFLHKSEEIFMFPFASLEII